MVSKLEYDDQCDKVLRYIFGRTLISRNLEIATKMSQEYHFDCVTLDGDQVNQPFIIFYYIAFVFNTLCCKTNVLYFKQCQKEDLQ